MVCALYSIVEEVGVTRTVEERVLFVKQSGFAEVTCFKGQITERTKKWSSPFFRVFWFCSHPSSPCSKG